MSQKIDNISERYWSHIYEGKFNIFDNKICKECIEQISSDNEMSSPQPLPFIGTKFSENSHKIMFVGKGTYSNEKQDRYDIFETIDIKDLFLNDIKPFWNWVREITESVLNIESKDDAFQYFAYSNLHKCQAASKGSDLDSSDYIIYETISENCIQKAGWIYREITEIKPRNVVLFLGYADDCYLSKLFIQNETGIETYDYSSYGLDSESFSKGKIVQLRDGDRRFILTNHPRGTPTIIRDEIIRIIKEDDWTDAINWKMPIPILE